MPFKSPKSALNDILANIELARSFVEGMSFDAFSADQRSVYAVTRCLEIISEASRRLPDSLKQSHPEIPWSQIAGAGSVYRHDYRAVSNRTLWDTVQVELEPLRIVAEQELKRLKE